MIPLNLAFTADQEKRYVINEATYDRSGRMEWEQFVVRPAKGTSDPLALYFKSLGVRLGGGLTGFTFLSGKPYSMQLFLNEWVRFDKPGIYHVSVVSGRVSDHNSSEYMGRPMKVTSNEILLKIARADPNWQKTELKRIERVLAGDPAPSPISKGRDARAMALESLRFLGTAQAAREMARLFRLHDASTDSACALGLAGSPHRKGGLEEMRRLLAAPDFRWMMCLVSPCRF